VDGYEPYIVWCNAVDAKFTNSIKLVPLGTERVGRLRARGVPPETLQFLPELKPLTCRFSYCDFDFYLLDRGKVNSVQSDIVTPVCCVVLERESVSMPGLVPLAEADLSRSLAETITFKEDDRFKKQRVKILEALAQLPAYHLASGSDPAIAAPFFRH
jgi:hypothetical protein